VIFSRFAWRDSKVLELTNASSAYIYYRKKRVNLLTGFPENYPLEKFYKELESIKLDSNFKKPRVIHFQYELGLIFCGLGHLVNDETPLATVIDYQTSKIAPPRKSRISEINLKSLERPSWSEYKVAFARVQEELLQGNCYQVNLTYPFDFETLEVLDPRDICDFFFSRPRLGAFAHGTFLGEELILSNSPECLFKFHQNELFTMPIKGTAKRGGHWKKAWEEILEDPKQEGELLMIVDLLKNDLNRLEKARARVRKLRAPLLVPGLVHQYSLLSVKIENELSLLRAMQSLFPGGSVTGAPKKRVMSIINETERFVRSAYCGSTLLCFKDIKAASINIRTASVLPAERLWRYGAGGGITLLSKAHDEYQEMEAKVKSFLTFIKSRGY